MPRIGYAGHDTVVAGEASQVNIGFVGLGAMGALIVPAADGGRSKVTGWNRSRDKAEPLIATGMAFAADTASGGGGLRHRVLDRDRFGGGQSRGARTRRHRSGLRKGGIYIDMSTIEPDASRAIAANSPRPDRSCWTGRCRVARSPSRPARPR